MKLKLLVERTSAWKVKMMIHLLLGFVLFLGTCLAISTQAFPAPVAHPEKLPYPLPSLGYVGQDGMLSYENIKKLSLPMVAAVKLLRDKKYQDAVAAFQKIQRSRPQEALAYQGEIEATQRLGTLNVTVARYRKLLTTAEAEGEGDTNQWVHLAVLHWALGVAVMLHSGYYPKLMFDPPGNIGSEPVQQFQEALRLDPNLLVAHLSLGAYYDHRSQQQGALARQEYEEALRLRPDLYQIRYLHATSWERPPVLLNQAQLVAHGAVIPEGEIRREDKAKEEYLALIKDHPNYAPPYYCLGDDYFYIDRATAYKYWRKYLELGKPDTEAWTRIKQIIDYVDAHPDEAYKQPGR